MKWYREIYLIDFNLDAYRNALRDHMKEQTREAARIWLARVLLIIPTWSRASRATFESLANAVGFDITYGPQRSMEDRLLLGLQTGRGGLDFKNKNQFYFFYETDLRYLAYNEFNHVVYGQAPNVFHPRGLLGDRTGRNPTPYHFQEAGQEAFSKFAETVRLPNPMNFINPDRQP